MLTNIRIVLVNTFHPGNIGSALRAMKTMGLTNLVLVSPQRFPDNEVSVMAACAADGINNICVVDTLEEAIYDCPLVIGTSARKRGKPWPLLNCKQCAEKVISESASGQVALVFGREKTGLTNHELQQCHFHVMIPASPDYPVLNLAQAVQILSYEIWLASQSNQKTDEDYRETSYPSHKAMAEFYDALEVSLCDINFIVKQHPGDIMIKLRRLFNRARPETQELNILRGILARVSQSASDKQIPESD